MRQREMERERKGGGVERERDRRRENKFFFLKAHDSWGAVGKWIGIPDLKSYNPKHFESQHNATIGKFHTMKLCSIHKFT
jgi:hypothetical protein